MALGHVFAHDGSILRWTLLADYGLDVGPIVARLVWEEKLERGLLMPCRGAHDSQWHSRLSEMWPRQCLLERGTDLPIYRCYRVAGSAEADWVCLGFVRGLRWEVVWNLGCGKEGEVWRLSKRGIQMMHVFS